MPTKKTIGINRIKKIRTHVISDAIGALTFPFKKVKNGLKTPVTTAARIIIEKKGRKIQPNKKIEMKKRTKKNHRIILGRILSTMALPIRF
jgi:hypothetical protein